VWADGRTDLSIKFLELDILRKSCFEGIRTRLSFMDFSDLIKIESCDLCGHRTFTPELTVLGWQLQRCSKCSLVFTSPRYSDAYLRTLYTENFYELASDGEYFNSQLQTPIQSHIGLAAYAKRKLRKPGKATSLDIGCGAGRLVAAFAKVGFNAEGIEPSLKAVDAARNAGLSVRAMDLDEIRHSSYDVITAMHVLEHTSSPSAFISACERILLPSGLLILEVPNYGCKRAAQLKEHWRPLYPDVHLFQFTPETLRLLLTKHGFQVVSYKFLGGAIDALPEDEGHSKPDTCSTIERRKWTNHLIGIPWRWRHMIFRIPRAQRTMQFLYWHLLGKGEFFQIIGRKT